MEERGRNTIEQIRSIPASGPPPDALLMKMLFGPLMQQCICVAAKLKISDLLAEHPQTIAELAAKTNTNEGALYRVLRMLSSSGESVRTVKGELSICMVTSPSRGNL